MNSIHNSGSDFKGFMGWHAAFIVIVGIMMFYLLCFLKISLRWPLCFHCFGGLVGVEEVILQV